MTPMRDALVVSVDASFYCDFKFSKKNSKCKMLRTFSLRLVKRRTTSSTSRRYISHKIFSSIFNTELPKIMHTKVTANYNNFSQAIYSKALYRVAHINNVRNFGVNYKTLKLK